MSDQKKPKKQRITTPKGIASYPWITKPDTKFKASGQYKCDLKLSGEDAAKLKAQIDTEVEKSYAEAVERAKTPAEAKAVYKAYPYKAETDEDENETGVTVFKFRQNAVIKIKKTGEERQVKIDIFDAKGVKVENIQIFGGSEVKIGYTMRPYAMIKEIMVEKDGKQVKKKVIEAGVTLDMGAVQVIKLVSSNAGSAEAWGFGDEGDGFDASDAPEQNAGDTAGEQTQGDAVDAGSSDF